MPLKARHLDQELEVKQQIFRSFQSIFDEISTRLPKSDPSNPRKINAVIAFSGGCDSICLLRCLSEFKDVRKGELTAVHVHHGISPNADSWAKFTEEVANECGIPFVLKKVSLEKSELGIEAEARRLRYLALEEVARTSKADTIFTAHHRDDQLETFLIQWMRGAGIEGLAGMPAISKEPIPISRPFLSLGRAELESYAKSRNWQWIEDESNTDTNYLRNLIRLKILPVLDEARPGFRKAAARSIQLVAESAEILKKADEEDFEKICTIEDQHLQLKLSEFLKFDPSKKSRLLRHWLRTQGIHQVPKHRIDSVLSRLKSVRSTPQRLMEFGKKELLLTHGFLTIRDSMQISHDFEVIFNWKGEKELRFPELGGSLLFKESSEGFPQEWLQHKVLSISLRRGKDRIKTKLSTPPKLIKVLCQEAEIDSFEREKLPVVRRERQIIYVAKLGLDVRLIEKSKNKNLISLEWIEEKGFPEGKPS